MHRVMQNFMTVSGICFLLNSISYLTLKIPDSRSKCFRSERGDGCFYVNRVVLIKLQTQYVTGFR